MAQLNFPDPNVTTVYTEAGITWTWNATLGVWSAETPTADGGIEEAPTDGNQYGRQNADWTVITGACSAWCISQATADLVREFNVATCTKGGGPGIYIYTFKEPMPDIQYSVQVTPSNSSQALFCTNTARTTDGFTVRVYKTDGSGQDSGHMVLIHAYN